MYHPKLNGEGLFLNNANRAYMVLKGLNIDGESDFDTGIPGGQLSNGYRFDFSGTTAIEEVVTEEKNATVYYDLSGRRIENPAKGIYILGGKKVYVK